MRREAPRLGALVLAAALTACHSAAAPPPPQATLAAAPPGTAPTPGDVPFEVALQAPARVKAGEAAVARVVVKAKGTFHVNRDYPMAFRPEPASVAAFGAEKLPLGEGAERTPCDGHGAEACTLSAPIGFTMRDAGPARLAGVVAFSVCNQDLCRIEKVPVAAEVVAGR